jgi:hypothetical protein
MWIPQASAIAEQPSACTYLSSLIDARSNSPAFLPSYPTAQVKALKGTAFLYDNAVAAIALVACNESQRATRIGDAIVAAQSRDRYWRDGRLRNAYLAGPVGKGAVRLPGYWDGKSERWVEDAYGVGSDSGNMAWAILALLALDQRSRDHKYRSAAVHIGRWLVQWQSHIGVGGFTGGTSNEEPNPEKVKWKSTEHNVDLAAAFTALARATHDPAWFRTAVSATNFVHAMWDPACHCFDAGTVEDGRTRNRYIALDAQLLPLLALPGALKRYSAALPVAKDRVAVGGGFAFGETKGGIWTEGTEQAALLMALLNRSSALRALTLATRSARSADGGYFATDVKELPTGLKLDIDQAQSRQYFHLVHLAPAAWAALVERRYNPFTRENGLP